MIGAQAGSEAKGKTAAYLTSKYQPDLMVGSFSPNAGHTLVIDGNKVISHNVPVCSYLSNAPLILTAGSAISLKVLKKDLKTCNIPKERLFIDNKAVIIQEKHIKEENEKLTHIASTTSGTGAAYRDRLMRVKFPLLAEHFREEVSEIGNLIDASEMINDYLIDKKVVLGEMTQGFDLDLLHGIQFPFTTSRPINPAQLLSDSGVCPDKIGTIYAAFRPYPIRVGNHLGYSGPYAEAVEINWHTVRNRCSANSDLTEYTTTTQRVRRVFEFSYERFKKMMQIVNPDWLVLNFANYLDWSVYGASDKSRITDTVNDFMNMIEDTFGIPVGLVGTGPNHEHIIDLLYNYKKPTSRGLLYVRR